MFARGRVPTGDAPLCIEAGSGSAPGVAIPWSGIAEAPPLGGGLTTGVPSGSVRGAGSYEGGTYGPTDAGAIDGWDGGAGAAGRWLGAPACAIDGAERGTVDAGGATEAARGASGARDDFDIGGTDRGASDGLDRGAADLFSGALDFGGAERAETRSGVAFGASDMRVVIGCALTGGRSAFSVTSASARPKSGGRAAAVAASSSPLVALTGAAGTAGAPAPGVMLGGAPLEVRVSVPVSGMFAAGATPHIVFVCFERAFTGRGIAPADPPERVELTSFRSSDRDYRPYRSTTPSD